MNTKSEYQAAFRNQRMLKVNAGWHVTDRFDARYNNACEFIKVSSDMTAKAKQSLLERETYTERYAGWVKGYAARWQAMVEEYKRSHNTPRWQKMKMYFGLIKVTKS